VRREALEAFEALDEWLTKGGFLPDEWLNKKFRKASR
jgi:hypothetical protein